MNHALFLGLVPWLLALFVRCWLVVPRGCVCLPRRRWCGVVPSAVGSPLPFAPRLARSRAGSWWCGFAALRWRGRLRRGPRLAWGYRFVWCAHVGLGCGRCRCPVGCRRFRWCPQVRCPAGLWRWVVSSGGGPGGPPCLALLNFGIPNF